MSIHPDAVKLPDPDAFVEVHMRLGIALWHCQLFEYALAHFVTLIIKLPPSRAEAEVRETLEKMQSRTLGSLISELRKANSTNSVSSFEQDVNRFLEDRNWLVHSSWQQHKGDLFEPKRVLPLLRRLDEIAERALALQTHFGALVSQWVRDQGVDPATVDAEQRRILAEWGVM
jgi:hypothetical protein